MSDIFKALADPTRREILLMLAQQPDSVSNLTEHFNMTRPAISKHLRVLRESELITIEADQTDGRQRTCYVQLEALAEVERYLAKLEKFWIERLDGLGKYLAQKKSNDKNEMK